MRLGRGSQYRGFVWMIGVCVTAGCAGGESDSVGSLGFTAGPSAATATTGGSEPTTAPEDDEDADAGTDSATTGSNPSTTASATDTQSETTGPLLACMFAEDCDDGDLCTADNCVNSFCANDPITCDDGVDCTVDSCDPGTGACSNTADDTLCIDDDLCNGAESCNPASGCVQGVDVACSDGMACTEDACDPSTGSCSFDAIETCSSGDGCCPLGCSVADTDCMCTNLGTSATASSSGGGQDGTGYGPSTWINGSGEDSCDGACTQCFGWIENTPSPGGEWMQLDWDSPIVVGSMFIDGIDPGGCQALARGLAGGTVQYWGPGGWTALSSFAGEQGDLSFSFDPPVTTTALRIFNAVAPAGGYNSLAFEWYVYEPLGCTP